MLHQLVTGGAGICTDSRQAGHGSIFFALRGESFNGNHYAAEALKAGCRLAVIDDPSCQGGADYLLVDSVLDTLQALGAYHRRLFDIPVIGITGSNGKTTTKELVHAVLSARFRAQATQGNLNNHIGVPVTLLSWKQPVDMAIVEMGANHVGEIARLCELAGPTHGLITNIGKAHLEGFGSVENIARAKSELYGAVAAANGQLFVNGDNHQLVRLAGNTRQVTYGTGDGNDCQGRVDTAFPLLGVSFWVNRSFGKTSPGARGTIRTQLTGAYNFENIMAAVTTGLYFGVSPEKIVSAIETYHPRNNRSQVMETKRNLVIADAYNANPTSMLAALENFSGFERKRTALLLGDMLELGETTGHEHRQLMKAAIEGGFTLLVFVGPAFTDAASDEKNLPDNCHVFKDVEGASAFLSARPLTGYKVLVKGSRGIRMETLLNVL